MMGLDSFSRRKFTHTLCCPPRAAPPRANWPDPPHPMSLSCGGEQTFSKTVAGNGLVLPQRHFIQFASYPLLRSEEWLGRGQLGVGWNALECNGRLLLNHIFSLQGRGCRQETGSCAVQRINSKEYVSTKHWSYHKLLHEYTQEIQSFIKCLRSSSLTCIISLDVLSFLSEGPWTGTRQP